MMWAFSLQAESVPNRKWAGLLASFATTIRIAIKALKA